MDYVPCWGGDTTFVVKTLQFGKYAEVDRYLFSRRRGESKDMRRYVREHNQTWLGQVFPFYEATRDLLREPHLPRDILIPLFLLKLNAIHTAWYYKTICQTWWSRIVRAVGRRRDNGPASMAERAAVPHEGHVSHSITVSGA